MSRLFRLVWAFAGLATFQASATMWTKLSPFWDVARRRFVLGYRRFGTSVRSSGVIQPRRMPGTGGCMSKIIIYYSLHEYYSRYNNTAKGLCLCAILQQWLHAVNQHCGLCSVATTSRRPVVWTVSAFPSGHQLDARGIRVRSQPAATDFSATKLPDRHWDLPNLQWIKLSQHEAINSPP